jgi:hypothetical protein
MDDLMMAVAERLIAQALDGYRPTAAWKENLRSLARGTYQAYLAAPAGGGGRRRAGHRRRARDADN